MLADPFMNDETAKWAKDMGVEAVTKDYKEILADPEIDAVLICSSTDTHSPISVEAIKAGRHVFCEKPIDHDVAKIKEVIDALKDSNVKYQVGFNRRFDHNFEAVQKAVADGKDRRYTYHQDHIQRSGAAMCRLCKSIRRNLP